MTDNLPKIVTVRVWRMPPFDWQKCDCPADPVAEDIPIPVDRWDKMNGNWYPIVTLPGGDVKILDQDQWR